MLHGLFIFPEVPMSDTYSDIGMMLRSFKYMEKFTKIEQYPCRTHLVSDTCTRVHVTQVNPNITCHSSKIMVGLQCHDAVRRILHSQLLQKGMVPINQKKVTFFMNVNAKKQVINRSTYPVFHLNQFLRCTVVQFDLQHSLMSPQTW